MRFILINFVRLLFLVVLVMVLRAAFGYVARALGGRPAGPVSGASAAGGRGSSGELKKDPVCGVFVSVQSSVKKTIDGEVMHFCSAACRDKFRAA
ncbi:MAG: hypothetical protein IT158_19775 [Bryobacterales bacterium]|nr:hypothetical protein [Bryobacterales bacterium]